MRSSARFPGASTNPGNLVVGPLVLVGGAEPTSARTIREFGGQKFPLLLKAGHKVRVQITGNARKFAGLYYIPRPRRGPRVTLRDTDPTITFVACRTNQNSGSSSNGVAVTFWSGFVVTRTPSCVPLDIYVDERPSPRRALLSLGARCST